jgi:HD-GYP domain-containing protein (c-di-GMP phosphodiesterase class II)/serine/threonine protein phosphatase PrpC
MSKWLKRVYAGGLLVGGLASLAMGARSLNHFEWNPDTGQSLVLWMAMATIAALAPIPLPWVNARIRWTAAIDLASILVFGPAVAAWIGLVSRVGAGSIQRKPPPHILRGTGRAIVAIGIAGAVYTGMHGPAGSHLFIDAARLLPIAACAVTYILATAVLTALGTALRTLEPASRALFLHLREKGALDLLILPFGALLAETQVRAGSVAVALFLIALLSARYVFILWFKAERDHLAIVRTLMSAVDAVDPFSRGHSLRVSKMCVAVAKRMGLSEREIAPIEYAALLHDVGRTAIRREILQKPGKLSENEYASVRAHPKFGHDILKNQLFFKNAAEIVYCHHEQPDGKGYPRELTAGQIPVGSRIIMVVAAFDAMTSDRPYRRGLSPETAFEELLRHTGTQFFSEIVEHLVELHSAGRLFDELDDRELEEIGTAEWNISNALADYLRRKGRRLELPQQPGDGAAAGTETFDEALDSQGMPTIAMPAAPFTTSFPLTPDGRWKLVVAARTDLGCVRKNNEDSFGAFPMEGTAAGGLLVLADGMGGAAAGEIASRMAVDLVSKTFQGSVGRGIHEALMAALRSANEAIFFRARGDQRLRGMGTTCTAAVAAEGKLYYAHAGDSRAYLINGTNIMQLTLDHTVIAALEATGGRKSVASAMKNVLTRCLGSQAELEVDMNEEPIELEIGDTLVLCSDGLSSVVETEEIFSLTAAESPDVACDRLVELARERGGPDNITVQVARVEGSGSATEPR